MRTHHRLLVGGAGDGHPTARVPCFLGHLHIHLPMVSGDETVVEVVVLDFQENGLPVYIVSTFQEVDSLGGDEHAVAIDVLHGDEAVKQRGSQTGAHNSPVAGQWGGGGPGAPRCPKAWPLLPAPSLHLEPMER